MARNITLKEVVLNIIDTTFKISPLVAFKPIKPLVSRYDYQINWHYDQKIIPQRKYSDIFKNPDFTPFEFLFMESSKLLSISRIDTETNITEMLDLEATTTDTCFAEIQSIVLQTISNVFSQYGWPEIPTSQYMSIENQGETIDTDINVKYVKDNNLRVLQLNVLADGLSGLDPLKGGFIGTPEYSLDWESRRWRLLYVILRQSPDIISLQECDHFESFFAPMLSLFGYSGVFSPKPNPTKPNTRPHGNAIFYKQPHIQLIQCTASILEVNSVASIPADSTVDISIDTDELHPSNSNVVHALFQMKNSAVWPPFIVSSTHLKSTKTYEGEIARFVQAKSLDSTVSNFFTEIENAQKSVKPTREVKAIDLSKIQYILCGDLNAATQPSNDIAYASYVYPALQGVDISVSNIEEAIKSTSFLSSFDLRSSYRFYDALKSFVNHDKNAAALYNAISGMSMSEYRRILYNICRLIPRYSTITQTRFSECPYSTYKTRKRGSLKHTIDVILISKGLQVVGLLDAIDTNKLPPYGSPCPEWPSDHFVISTTIQPKM